MTSKQMIKFRETFNYAAKEKISWYPGHMAKGMNQMQKKLKNVDCIVEVHDARIPFSGRNPNFYNMLTMIKPHILALSKKDLIDMNKKPQIVEKLKAENVKNVIFTNCKDEYDKEINQLLPKVLDLIENSNRYQRSFCGEYCMMIIGIPNVGKSSLINALRNRYLRKEKASKVGPMPGVTRSVLEKIKINEDPLTYLLDTPGILTPTIRNAEVSLRLALCATVKENLIHEETLADYLLFRLNKAGNYSYMGYLGLDDPCDDIKEVLLRAAVFLRKTITVNSVDGRGKVVKPDFSAAARHFIDGFRNGAFGKIILDDDLL